MATTALRPTVRACGLRVILAADGSTGSADARFSARFVHRLET